MAKVHFPMHTGSSGSHVRFLTLRFVALCCVLHVFVSNFFPCYLKNIFKYFSSNY